MKRVLIWKNENILLMSVRLFFNLCIETVYTLEFSFEIDVT